MKVVRGVKCLLLTACLVFPVIVVATDFYWNLSNPPGNVHWTEGTAITGADTLFVNNPLNPTQDISNDGTIDLYSNLTVVNTNINGGGDFNINSGATLIFDGPAITAENTFVNQVGGAVDFTSSSIVSLIDVVSNFGEVNVAGTVNDGNLINQVGGTINFAPGAVANIVVNVGDMSIANDLTLNGFGNLGNLLISASLHNSAINNDGEITISGNRSIANGAFTGLAASHLNLSITSSTTYDSLTVGGDIDLSDSIVDVTSSFSAPGGSNFHWDLLSSSTNLITNGGTTINIPTSTAFEQWSEQIMSNTILRIFYVNNGPSLIPLPGVDSEIAAVLASMQANVTNSGQAELLAAVNSVTTQDLYNYLLSNLQPDTNNSSSSTTLAMQNIGFNKIEYRVAGTSRKFSGKRNAKRNSRARKSKANRTKTKSGFASGDLTPNTSMWMAGFGSLSKQHASGDNQGYRAKILGGMLGLDTKSRNDDVYGIAFGVSNANVYGLENTTFTTRILGYNLMVYGSNNLKRNFFLEWIASGVINKNHGVRVFGVSGIDLSTESSYRGALGGARVNVGKMFKLNNTFNLSQVNTVQYALVHQSGYDEGGSVAALHVATKENQSILTLGTGLRLGIFNNDSWLTGNRELRAMVTYDVISPNQATTANFVVGSDSFLMNSSAVRLALKLGADYGVMISRKLSLQFSYDYEMRAGYYDNFGEVKLRYMF